MQGLAVKMVSSSQACSAHKSSEICERCRLDAPEHQLVNSGTFRTVFDLSWDYALGVVAFTADRKRRARLWVKNGDHFLGKTAKKLIISLVSVGRQLT